MGQPCLVEREGELGQLAGLLVRARGGDGGVVVVGGPAGIGKTALLDAAAAGAAGFRVLRGRCGEVERELSFGLVRDLLVPAVRAAPPARRRRWFSGAACSAAAVLGEGPEAVVDPVASMHGLYWLLAAVAEEAPVLVVADDVHWSDESSLRWLVYLARRVEGLAVALVVASRVGEGGDGGLLAQLAAVEGAVEVRPAPLSERGTGEVIAGRTGMPPALELTRACHAAAGGNPWLLGELLLALEESGVDVRSEGGDAKQAFGAERMRSRLRVRLRRLGSGAMRLAAAVAVLGDGCELRVAAGLAELDGTEADAAV